MVAESNKARSAKNDSNFVNVDKTDIKPIDVRKEIADAARVSTGTLAKKLKPIIAEQAKEQQIRKSVSQKSVEQKPIDTQKELASIAGVSHDTIHKVEVIEKEETEKYTMPEQKHRVNV